MGCIWTTVVPQDPQKVSKHLKRQKQREKWLGTRTCTSFQDLEQHVLNEMFDADQEHVEEAEPESESEQPGSQDHQGVCSGHRLAHDRSVLCHTDDDTGTLVTISNHCRQ
jgi:hypothetical protein